MKASTYSWYQPAVACGTVCAATWMLGLSISLAEEAQPAQPSSTEKKTGEKTEKTEADYRNWFDLSVGGTLIDGDKAQFMQRHGLPKGAFGGVESFHYEQDVGKKGLF